MKQLREQEEIRREEKRRRSEKSVLSVVVSVASHAYTPLRPVHYSNLHTFTLALARSILILLIMN
jgi:hypothetical protein